MIASVAGSLVFRKMFLILFIVRGIQQKPQRLPCTRTGYCFERTPLERMQNQAYTALLKNNKIVHYSVFTGWTNYVNDIVSSLL